MKQAVSTKLIHADHSVDDGFDCAPPIHVSTTYSGGEFVYARVDTPTRKRVEKVLAKIEGDGPNIKAYTFSSGLSALATVLLAFSPKKVVACGEYQGSKTLFAAYQAHHEKFGGKPIVVQQVQHDSLDFELESGDILFIEAPHNGTCIVPNIPLMAEKAHEKDVIVIVDSTFSTPIGIQPLSLGADIVMHSSTKYLGGHSDLLGGVLVFKEMMHYCRVRPFRSSLGNVMGSMETFLLLRSLRTLSLRVERQSKTAWEVAQWLAKHPKVKEVSHPFLESHPTHQMAKELLLQGPACFLVQIESQQSMITLAENVRLFARATSLGGVESLIDERSLGYARISIGLEDPQDLINDLEQALNACAKEVEVAAVEQPQKKVKKENDACNIC